MEDFSDFSFTTGTVRLKNLAYLLATKDDLVAEQVPHSRIYYRFNGAWYGLNLEWMASSGTVCHKPDERFAAVGPAGFAEIVGGGAHHEEKIGRGSESPQARGPLREVRGIAQGRAYAVGTARQAYRRDAPNRWVRIDQSAQTPGVGVADTCFESIDGFSETDIYAVGWEGEIWRYDGRLWRQVESPTNLALYKVRCAGDEHVYACGQVGTLLRGRGDEWREIDHGATEEDLWGLEWFNDRLYVSSMHLLYELQGDVLAPIGWGEEPPPGTCYHLSAADGIMWSIGAKDVMEFDGQTWTKVV